MSSPEKSNALSRREFLVGAAASLTAALAACSKEPEVVPTGSTEVVRQIDELVSQMTEVKKQVAHLEKRIDDAKGGIDQTSAASIHKTILELMKDAASVLDMVVDGGPIDVSGRQTLDHALQRRDTLGADLRFSTEQRAILAHQWQERVTAISHSIDHLAKVRDRSASLLTSLQQREDYIDELVKIQASGGSAPDILKDVERNAVELKYELAVASRDLNKLSQEL